MNSFISVNSLVVFYMRCILGMMYNPWGVLPNFSQICKSPGLLFRTDGIEKSDSARNSY